MKLFIWRLILRKGWYEIRANNGFYCETHRAFWDGKQFKQGDMIFYHWFVSIFVRRLKNEK